MLRSQLSLASVCFLSTVAALQLFANAHDSNDSNDELLFLVRAANKAAVESIQTLHCKAQLKAEPADPSIASEGEYWRSRDLVRIHQVAPFTGTLFPANQLDVVCMKSVATYCQTSIQNPADVRRASATRRRGDRVLSGLDVWSIFMRYPGAGGANADLDHFLDLTRENQKMRWVNQDGRKLVLLESVLPKDTSNEGNRDDVEIRIWFDPQANYLPCKRITRWKEELIWGKDIRTEEEISGFAEPLPGFYFPQGRTSRIYSKDKLVQTQILTVTDIHVNKPIPDSLFRLRFPHGCTLVDLFDSTEYRVDSQGSILEKVRSFSPVAQELRVSPPLTSAYSTQSESEPVSWTTWFVWASFMVLALFLCGWLLWWRAHRPSDIG